MTIALENGEERGFAAEKAPARLARHFVLLYCLWQAADLGTAWTSNSPESWGWLLFAVWLLPAILGLANPVGRGRPQVSLLIAAVLLSFAGQLTWLNVLQHMAVTFAVAGWQRPVRRQAGWMAAGFCWMPACGWLLDGWVGGGATAVRLIAIAAVIAAVIFPAIRGSRVALAMSAVSTALLTLTCGDLHAETVTYSPVQATARPFGLETVDGVQLAGSDAAAADFMSGTLPTMQQMIDANLGERSTVVDPSLISLKPESLTLAVATDVRVYFVGEGAGYHNTLGFNTAGGGIDSGDPLLIFPNASSPNSYLSSGGKKRTASEPLFPGDFVDLGQFGAGTNLDFFLISNGASGGSNVYSTDPTVNPDGIIHVVAFGDVVSPYLLIGFEDLYGGGDQDFNDLLFAVYFGEQNVQTLIQTASLHGMPAPEPGFIWLIVLTSGGWLVRKRRRRIKQQAGR